jgi:hypothetical protein
MPIMDGWKVIIHLVLQIIIILNGFISVPAGVERRQGERRDGIWETSPRHMEIISIPLSGELEHKDSMGNVAVIKAGEVQVMSAGSGIYHSEFNKREDKEVRFLQIWVFSNKKNVTPRYDQISIKEIAKDNAFYQILSPNSDDQGVWIYQDAGSTWVIRSREIGYHEFKKKGNGLYVFCAGRTG